MKLILKSSEGGIARLVCEGEVTQADFVTEGNPFKTVLGSSCFEQKVLLDLQKAAYVDSAGVGWLVMSHKSFREQGGMLVVHSVPPMVDHVFRLLRMPTVLHLAENEASALALAQGGKP